MSEETGSSSTNTNPPVANGGIDAYVNSLLPVVTPPVDTGAVDQPPAGGIISSNVPLPTFEGDSYVPKKTERDEPDLTRLDKVLATSQGLISNREDRLGRRRSESADLVDQIRDEGRREAFSAAMMQLGAGIAGGDLSGGLQRAGDAATSVNALSRDAARAEGRSMRDYEESSLNQIDDLNMQSSMFDLTEEQRRAAIASEQTNADRDYDLNLYNAEQDSLTREFTAGMSKAELEIQQNEYTAARNDLMAKFELEQDKEGGLQARAGLGFYEDYMSEIMDSPALRGMTTEARIQYLDQEKAKIGRALASFLPADFIQMMSDSVTLDTGSGDGVTPPLPAGRGLVLD